MKFAISRDHRQFFEQRHAIEFEGLFEASQLEQLVNAINSAVAQRLNLRVTRLDKQSPQALFMAGRDLWRTNAAIKKIVANPRLAEIAAKLTGQRMMRLGYDQFFPSPVLAAFPVEKGSAYDHILHKPSSLDELSPLQGVACGLMLCLTTGKGGEITATEPTVETPETVQIFSDIAGNGFFFDSTVLIDFPSLFNKVDQQYLMIVYTRATAVYIFKQSDPLHHMFMNAGYSLGDKLKDTLNPIVYRE